MESKVEESKVSLLTGDPVEEQVIWSGETWPLACFSPLTCQSVNWHITTKRIEKSYGFRGGNTDTIDLRRITDITYVRSPIDMCTMRGSIVIHSTMAMDPVITISGWGLKPVYQKLKEAWLASNANQFIMSA